MRISRKYLGVSNILEDNINGSTNFEQIVDDALNHFCRKWLCKVFKSQGTFRWNKEI